MDTIYVVLICIGAVLFLGIITFMINGMLCAKKSAKRFNIDKKALKKEILLGAFVGNKRIVMANCDKIEIVLDGENFYFQQNIDYTIYTSRWYAKELKKGYFKDTCRTVRGLDYELVAHYLFYLIKNKHAVDGSYLGTDYKTDKSAKLFEFISKFLP